MRLSKFLRSLILASGVAASVVAQANGVGQGAIQPNWNIYGDGNLFFYLSGAHSGSPCSITERWAFDTTSVVGKSYLATFLMAYASGHSILVLGNGTCTHGNTETVTDFRVID
jgi:hypothetical protein